MKVKATKLGFYNNIRVKEGTVFNIESEKHFSNVWMKAIDSKDKEVKEEPAKKRRPSKTSQDVI